MQLRLATPDDAKPIAKLHAESWRSAYRGMYRDDYLDGPVEKDRKKVWKKRFEQPAEDQYVLLATEGDSLVGFVCAFGNDDERWGTLVDNLHVLPARHRGGLGRTLLAGAAAWSRQRHPEALVHLWVIDRNANARAFYEHLGGQPQDSKVSEPPGGGSITGIRYVWQGPALDALASLTA